MSFLKPMHAWAKEHHTQFRSQSYGYPPVTLSSNRFEDLPEGEGKATFMMWREFSDTRWAASAGHLVSSAGHFLGDMDVAAFAGFSRHAARYESGSRSAFSAGHQSACRPRMALLTAFRRRAWLAHVCGSAAFDAHNPWFFAMPDLTRYLQRVSFALRQGEPANDVALLLPNDDVWASFHATIAKRLVSHIGGGLR